MRPATDLEAAYGPTLSEAERKLTIGQLMSARLSGHPEYADRVLLAPIELIVRDVDEKGKILAVGVSFEPSSTPPKVPVFLSAGEMRDRIAGWFGRRNDTAAPAASDEATKLPADD